MGVKTGEKSWGPPLSGTEFWLATLKPHAIDEATVKKHNDPDRIRRETAWGRPKVFFGPDQSPLDIIGGQFRMPPRVSPQ